MMKVRISLEVSLLTLWIWILDSSVECHYGIFVLSVINIIVMSMFFGRDILPVRKDDVS